MVHRVQHLAEVLLTSRLPRRPFAAAVLLLFALGGCGGGDGDGGGGGGGPIAPSGQGPGTSGATITIGPDGTVNPAGVSITVGQSVTFVNNDSRPHQIASDPHPTHTNCPSINALGVVGVGQTRLTNAFSGAGTCGFHDHDRPDDQGLKGTITVR